MTDAGDVIRQSEDNVEQERVQDNPNWGAQNRLPEERGQDYWEDVTDENREADPERLER